MPCFFLHAEVSGSAGAAVSAAYTHACVSAFKTGRLAIKDRALRIAGIGVEVAVFELD